MLVEPVLCSCTVVTSQPDTVDMTVTYFSAHRRLGPKSDQRENNSHPCAQRTLYPFCVVFHTCRSGRPDNINSQEVARPQNFVMGNDETELELSVESRSFVNRVNDQVRKDRE